MNNDAKFSAHRFLIIGGTSKAGTTSIFNYLENHPQICPSRAKETRFFLDVDYPLSSEMRYQKDGPEAYLSFFDCNDRQPGEKWRFEASPDYLHSADTPRIIHETLPNVRFIFILREPMSRLLSMYRFGQSINVVPLRMTFDEYVQIQIDTNGSCPDGYRHPAFCALQQGRYSTYLKPFLELFGKPSIHIRFYEELQRDPFSFMVSICRFAGIDGMYFRNYSFNVANKGKQVRSPRLHRAYFEAKEKLRRSVRNAPKLRWLLRQVRRSVDVTYAKLNVTKSAKLVMSSSTEQFLCSYYRDEASHLRKLLETEIPWPEKRPSSDI